MKTKIVLLLGIVSSLIMIGYSIYQGGVVYEEKKKHYDKLEEARRQATLYGGRVEQTSGITSYAKATRTAGKVVMTLTLLLIGVSVICIKAFRQKKGLFIFHIIGAVVLLASTLFSLVMMTSTGAATFDETFVVWVLFGVIWIVLYGLSLAKLNKINLQAA